MSVFSQDIEQLDLYLEGNNLESYQEDLTHFLEYPLNLNTASLEELILFPLLSTNQAQEIVNYRTKYGGLVEVSELQVLPSFSAQFVNTLSAYFTVKSRLIFEKKDQHQLIIRHYWKHQNFIKRQDYWRYQASIGYYWKIGLIAENDQDEDFFKNSNPSVDYYNGFVKYESNKFVQKVLLGAYRLQLGQGLLFWNGWGLGKTNTTETIQKRGASLQAYTSSNEVKSLQGCAIQLGKKQWEWTNFISYKKRDARIENEEIQTLYQTGLHRTSAEKEHEDRLRETIVGSAFQAKYRHLKLGTTMAYFHYQYPFAQKYEVYNQFDFYGKKLWNGSIYYNYTKPTFSLFAEYVQQSHHQSAFLQGIKWKPSLDLTYVGLYRNYQKSFFELYANAIGETSKPRNERGFYQAIDWNLSPKIVLHAATDYFEFPTPRYDVRFPSHGKEYSSQLTYKYSSFFDAYIRYKHEEKQVSYQGESIDKKRQQVRIGLNYQYYDWKFQSSFASHFYQKEREEQGILLGQTIQYKLSSQLKFTYRLVYYSIPSFQSAIYWYEHNILYTFSLPAYYGNGIRQYFLTRYKINNMIRLEGRVGYQHFVQETKEQTKWDTHLQFIYTF